MQLRNTALCALVLIATSCASAPEAPAPVQLNDLTIGNTDVDLLADIMRREDNRQYDSAAFHAFGSSASPVVRKFAVRALGRIGNRAAASPLIRALSDSNVEVRSEAAFALGELVDSSVATVEALGALANGTGADAAEAVDALGKIRTEAARAHVERALNGNATALVTQAALLSIYRFPRRSSTTPLIVRHTTSQDPETRWRAVYALTRTLADPVVVSRLLDVLRTDENVWAASFAARGLRAVTVDSAGLRAQAIALLTARITDSRPAVRINAITALTGYRDSTLLGRLTPLLGDSDPNTVTAAIQAIAASGGAQAVPFLINTVNKGAPVVRGAAMSALVSTSAGLALQVMEQVLASDPDWRLRLYAARALGNARGDTAVLFLRQLTNYRDPRVVVAALETAAGLRDTLPATRTLFIQHLASADPFVRTAALGGLERFADPADQILLFDAYARALRDTVPDAAVAALDAIAKLGQKNAAVARAFAVRFPAGTDCPNAEIRKALNRHFQVPDNCGVAATSRVYEQAVRDFIVPSLSGTNPRARITTSGMSAGTVTIEIELLAADAPLTVRNFINLAQRGYFNGSRWHRVVPNFVVQDGDPYGNGSGGPGYAIRDEINRVRYLDGVVGMALSGPDTGGSQFFITHSPQPHLDGGYTVFGRVINGPSSALYRVVQDDVIERIEILR